MECNHILLSEDRNRWNEDIEKAIESSSNISISPYIMSELLKRVNTLKHNLAVATNTIENVEKFMMKNNSSVDSYRDLLVKDANRLEAVVNDSW